MQRFRPKNKVTNTPMCVFLTQGHFTTLHPEEEPPEQWKQLDNDALFHFLAVSALLLLLVPG